MKLTSDSNKCLAINNSISSVSQQIINVILQFITRKIFLIYIGVELLGLNGTFASVISAATLAESGATNVIIYKLYKAISDDDDDEINRLMNITRFYMTCIGGVVFIATIAFLPFIPHILTNVEITPSIYGYFILQSAATISSYFLSYKRVILVADRRNYICNNVDTAFNVIFSFARIFFIVYYRSYVMYLFLFVAQTVVSNCITQMFCQQRFKFLKREKPDLPYFKTMFSQIKDLFMGTLAAYVYKSSDNIIVSKMISTVAVGFVGNYTTVTASLKGMALAAVSIIGPIMGNQAAQNNRRESLNKTFLFYDYGLYFLAMIMVIPECVLIKSFIIHIWGVEFLLSDQLTVLLILDQYLVLVQDCNGVLLSVTGHFKELKISDGIAAMANIILSIVFSYIWGIEGIFTGTIVSRLFQWILKSYYAHIMYWKETKMTFIKYWLDNLIKFGMAICGTVIAWNLVNIFTVNYYVIDFICKGIIAITVAVVFTGLYGIYSKQLSILKCFVKGR